MAQNAARIIAIMNQKGGVGKTTTTVNLGHALALAGQRVALLDLDPQGQVATSLGFDNNQPGLDSVLLDGTVIDDIKIPARDRLDLIVAGTRLNEFEHTSQGGIQRGASLA